MGLLHCVTIVWMRCAFNDVSVVCIALHTMFQQRLCAWLVGFQFLDALCVLVVFHFFGCKVISDLLLHYSISVRSGESNAFLLRVFGPTQIGARPVASPDNHCLALGIFFADPASRCIVIRGVLRHPPMWPVIQQ